MTDDFTGHRFNDDLLANPDDLPRARVIFPNLAEALDHPELRDYFQTYDKPANAAKRRSRRAGFAAVTLAAMALAGGAAEPVYSGLPASSVHAIGLATAISGIAGALIGWFGLLFAGAKHEWLYRRMMTERLRQFHFQALVSHWPEIVEAMADPAKWDDYKTRRTARFEAFRVRFEGRLAAEFSSLVDDVEEDDTWLAEMPAAEPPAETNAAFDELFKAYLSLRITHQLQYANYQLRDQAGLLPKASRAQAVRFAGISLICILAMFVIDVGVGLAIGVGMPAGLVADIPPLFHVLALWLAIVAVVVRTLEEGLQPEREIERYRHYRAGIIAIRDRFRASSQPTVKLAAMADFERLSFDEMRVFLKTHNESRFVM